MVDNNIDQGSIKSNENREHKQKLVLARKQFQKSGCVFVAMRNLNVAIDARNIDKLFIRNKICFQKLDLRSGYHQGRMKEEHIFKIAFKKHEVATSSK